MQKAEPTYRTALLFVGGAASCGGRRRSSVLLCIHVAHDAGFWLLKLQGHLYRCVSKEFRR